VLAHESPRDDTEGERRDIAALLNDIRTDLAKIATDATTQIDAVDSVAGLVREALLRLNWDADVVTEALEALSTPGPLDALAQDILGRHLATFDVIEHSVPLAWPIAASLAIPERLSRRCYYDRASGSLHFRGSMTVADYLALRALSFAPPGLLRDLVLNQTVAFTGTSATIGYEGAYVALTGSPSTFTASGGAIELTLETAKDLRAALDRAIAAAEVEEAEVRGKSAACSLVEAA